MLPPLYAHRHLEASFVLFGPVLMRRHQLILNATLRFTRILLRQKVKCTFASRSAARTSMSCAERGLLLQFKAHHRSCGVATVQSRFPNDFL